MIIAKESINRLARMDATIYEASANEPDYNIPQHRYDTVWMQNLYENYFWSNLRDLRGEGVVWELH